MLSPSPSSFFAVSLGLLALSSSTVAQVSLNPSQHNALLMRRASTSLVDPVASLDFSSTVPSDCKYPCGELITMDNSCSSEASCTDKLLCSVSGLNALVTCNNCVLQLANRTTGVSSALYANVTTILISTESLCKNASLTASPNATIIPFVNFSPWVEQSTAQTNLSGDGVTSSGVGAAGETDDSTASTSSTAASGASPRLVMGGGAVVATVLGGLMAVLL